MAIADCTSTALPTAPAEIANDALQNLLGGRLGDFALGYHLRFARQAIDYKAWETCSSNCAAVIWRLVDEAAERQHLTGTASAGQAAADLYLVRTSGDQVGVELPGAHRALCRRLMAHAPDLASPLACIDQGLISLRADDRLAAATWFGAAHQFAEARRGQRADLTIPLQGMDECTGRGYRVASRPDAADESHRQAAIATRAALNLAAPPAGQTHGSLDLMTYAQQMTGLVGPHHPALSTWLAGDADRSPLSFSPRVPAWPRGMEIRPTPEHIRRLHLAGAANSSSAPAAQEATP